MYYTVPLAHHYRTFTKLKSDPGTVLDVVLGPTYGVPGGRATDSPTE